MHQILFDFRTDWDDWVTEHVATKSESEPLDTNNPHGAPCCVCGRETETAVICPECGEDVCCACYLGHVWACRERWAKTTRRKSTKGGDR